MLPCKCDKCPCHDIMTNDCMFMEYIDSFGPTTVRKRERFMPEMQCYHDISEYCDEHGILYIHLDEHKIRERLKRPLPTFKEVYY